MRRRIGLCSRTLLALSALAFLTQPARADLQEPGSLLVFQEYDNRAGVVTMLTVTNTRETEGVLVEWHYYEQDFCTESDRTDALVARDTLSLLTNFHVPSLAQGYVVAFATNELGEAIVFNDLIGTTLVVDGLATFEYAVNPAMFLGIGDGVLTDLNGNGAPDLDGLEYSLGPDELLFPRFLGQGPLIQSELLLIDLTGGGGYTAQAGVLLYNDNEIVFSAVHDFSCWTRVPLEDVTPAFSNVFLQTTDDDPDEINGFPDQEAGWFRVDGLATVGPEGVIEDPLLLGLLVERKGNRSAAGRPFHLGEQEQGSPVLPPECPAGVSIEIPAWNHQAYDFDLDLVAGVVDPAGLPVTIVITSITQDEPVNGDGDGDTVCDGSGLGTHVASIRAERAAQGNGRVYRVSYTATNSGGAECQGALEFTVRRKKKGPPAEDDGQLFDSTEGC